MTNEQFNQIIELIDNLKIDAIEGYTKALPAYVLLRVIEDAASEAREEIRDLAYSERLAFGKDTVKIKGYQIELYNARRNYSYSKDSTWVRLKQQLKDHESLMCMAAEGIPLANTDTGEMINPAEISYSPEGIRLVYKGE